MKSALSALSIVSLLAGCAGSPPPSDHLASAVAETRAAQEAGAANVPRAALHLKLAEEQVTQARRMMKDGKNERADYMTLRAYNDAQLAIALTKEEEAMQRARQASAALQNMNQRPTP